jgi:acyl-coenzyme A thioesterase PaaI-like protein
LALRHHDLCFGCGISNLFGLQMEVEPAGEGRVEGRFFVKQDHQGPDGAAHRGVIAAALEEAMALCVQAEGVRAAARRLEVELVAPARVGEFVRVEAQIADRDEGKLGLRARAFGADDAKIAEASGQFVTDRPD